MNHRRRYERIWYQADQRRVVFFLIFLTGFWLDRAGKPYRTALLTVHKLIGLAAGIWLVVMVYRTGQAASLSPAAFSMTLISAASFVALVATGGVVSAMKQAPQIVVMVHHVVPYLAVLSSGITLLVIG